MRTHSKLHPKTSSALEFICTSMDSSKVVSEDDKSEEEAMITLEQVNMMCVTTNIFIIFLSFRCNGMLILGQLPSGEVKIYQLFVSSHPAETR